MTKEKTLSFNLESIIGSYKYDFFEKGTSINDILINYATVVLGSGINSVMQYSDEDFRVKNIVTGEIEKYLVTHRVESERMVDVEGFFETIRDAIKPLKDMLYFDKTEDFVVELDRFNNLVDSTMTNISNSETEVIYNIVFINREIEEISESV